MKRALFTSVTSSTLSYCAALTLVLFSAVSLTACSDRAYLTKTHGRAYNEAFTRQQTIPDPNPRNPKSLQGLDSQEAAAVARTYRRGLSKDGASDASGAPIVITNPALGAPAPNMPPPSVPGGH